VSTNTHVSGRSCITPIAPALETTSCWKPDSIQASARASFGSTPYTPDHRSIAARTTSRLNGAPEEPRCAPRGRESRWPGTIVAISEIPLTRASRQGLTW
jgi:hypothetical protein